MPKKRPFRYQTRDPAHLQARKRQYKFDEGFEKAVRQAHRENPEQLCELLRSDDPLSNEHRAALADLIERRLKTRPTKGRPPGATLSNPVQEMEHRIVNSVRQKLTQLRKANGEKSLPRGTISKVIAETVNEVGEIFGGDVPELKNVSLDNIRNAVKRGEKKTKH